jgi:hypothetical protein
VRALGEFWSGRLGLAEAFWTWAVLIGAAVNAVATAGTFAVIAAGWPDALALGIHLSPLPFNGAIVVGVWRSARAYEGAHLWADLARTMVIVWAGVLTLA